MPAPVQELRQYTMRSGGRDTLVELFRSDLVREQQECGMTIGGVFADEDRPDRFVWWRGFPSHAERIAALEDFYLGPRWARYRDAANATMIDSDDVALLMPFGLHGPGPDDHVALMIMQADSPRSAHDIAHHLATKTTRSRPALIWVTDPTTNGFARLPVRDDFLAVVAVGAESSKERDDVLRELVSAVSNPGEIAQTARLTRLL